MNKTRSLLLVAAAGGALAFATTARADSTLVINRQITSLTNIPFNGLGVSERTIITFDQSPIPSLDLGNFNAIQFNILAPPGEKLVFDQTATGGAAFDYSNRREDSAPIEPCAPSLINSGGSSLSQLDGACGVGAAGNAFFVEVDVAVPSGASGTGLQISFDFVPPPHQAPSDFSFQSLAGADYLTFIGNEPSSVVSLESVPEPSSILMLGSAMIFLGWALQKRNSRYNKTRLGFTHGH